MVAPTIDHSELHVADFLDNLRNELERLKLRECTLLVGVSGGADSVALLRGLLHFRESLDFNVIVGHLNHRLRGDQSQADAQWVAALAHELSVEAVVEEHDVRPLAAESSRTLEETARHVRYEFFAETATRLGGSHVAVAHTADDQAETILHHVLRGTGLSGLGGMPVARPLADNVLLVRPLLEVTRDEVEQYLRELNQPHLTDASNADETFTRNRLRHELLPLLREKFNPRVDEALRRLGRQASEVQQLVDDLAGELLQRALLDAHADACRLDCQVFAGQPRTLVRECFIRLWRRQDWPRQAMGFAEWDRLAELTTRTDTATLPGAIEARRRGNLLVLRRAST